MSDEEIKKVFSRNLRMHLAAKGKQPVDIVNELGISFSTVSNWINGQKFPRMGKVELLAQWLGIEKSDLIEDKPEDDDYYLDPQARELARDIFSRPELRALMDAARDVQPENLRIVADLIEKLKGTNE